MPVRRLWDKYEAIILLEAFIRVKEGVLERKKAILEVSRILRMKAQNEGFEMDNIFRNEAGITFQMYSMESAVLGYTVKKPASKLFLEIVELRSNDREQYNILLIEAKRMINTENSVEEKLNSWVSDQMSSEKIADFYSALRGVNIFCRSRKIINGNIWNITDLDVLMKVLEIVDYDKNFKRAYRKQIKRMSDAVKKYIDFVEIIDEDTKKTCDNSVNREYIEDDEKIKPKLNRSMDKFEKILCDNFSEGLIPNAIRLDKFRILYENQFKEEVTQDNDLLIEQLKEVGTVADGRIYPRHGEYQSGTLNEIRTEIMNTLNSKATCVFISSVMRRWEQELSQNLNIYNQTALKEMILAEEMPGIYANNIMFKKTQGRINFEKEIINYMKQNHAPVTYAQLEKELWYIPIDSIKHVLVTEPSLVLVDWETYMYALNFPATNIELNNLKREMNEKLYEKGFLVARDVEKIIKEKFQAIAINTTGYKDWAYRNILKYIMRDDFEFGSSVISSKGKKLEMHQVYRSFCLEHERLTTDELKQFSGEVGVQIYWEDVLMEMVRISANELIRKDLIKFDVQAIDCVLDEMCQDEYIPINDITLFLHFPAINYPWNHFVLESYLQYSSRFDLYHVSYSENKVFGIVVKKNSLFKDYRQVVIDMLANNNEWTDETNALAWIVKKGCQARKRWTGFDKVLNEASLRREKILNERK